MLKFQLPYGLKHSILPLILQIGYPPHSWTTDLLMSCYSQQLQIMKKFVSLAPVFIYIFKIILRTNSHQELLRAFLLATTPNTKDIVS